MLKQISLAALAATFITGSAAVAYAESNVSGIDGSGTSSLQSDWTGGRGASAYSATGSSSVNAYGYASERKLVRSHQHGRNNARTKHKY